MCLHKDGNMFKTVEAVYEKGQIKLKSKFNLKEKTKLLVTILDSEEPKSNEIENLFGFLPKRVDPIKFQWSIRNEWG